MAVGILLVVIAAAYDLIIVPVMGFYDGREALIADRSMLVPRLHAAGEALPALQSEVSRLKVAVAANRMTLEGDDDAIAAAGLASRIEKLASDGGLAIIRTEAITPEDDAGYRKVGLRMTINGEYEAIAGFLVAIESGVPPLILANPQIRAATPGGNPRLEMGFEVYGYRNPDHAPKS